MALLAAVAEVDTISDEVGESYEGVRYVDDFVLLGQGDLPDEDLPPDHNPPGLQSDGRPNAEVRSRQPEGAVTTAQPRVQPPDTSPDF